MTFTLGALAINLATLSPGRTLIIDSIKGEGWDNILSAQSNQGITVYNIQAGNWSILPSDMRTVRADGPEVFQAYANIAGGAPLIVASVGFLFDFFFEEIDRKIYLRQKTGPFQRLLGILWITIFSFGQVAMGIYQIKTEYFTK